MLRYVNQLLVVASNLTYKCKSGIMLLFLFSARKRIKPISYVCLVFFLCVCDDLDTLKEYIFMVLHLIIPSHKSNYKVERALWSEKREEFSWLLTVCPIPGTSIVTLCTRSKPWPVTVMVLPPLWHTQTWRVTSQRWHKCVKPIWVCKYSGTQLKKTRGKQGTR